MRYSYRCNESKENRCTVQNWIDAEDKDDEIAIEVDFDDEGEPKLEEPLTWEVQHGMTEDPEVRCPLCDQVAYRAIRNLAAFYFRGNCYLDKDGCQRDMNVYKLRNDDPYGHMRQPGEVDDMISKLKKAGTKKGKIEKTRKYFRT